MIEPTEAYKARVDLISQPTVYVLNLPDLGINYSTEEVVGLSTSSLLAERPQGAQSQTNPLTGASDIGSLALKLLDARKAVTLLRQQNRLVGQEAEVLQGYRGLPFVDYLSILTGKVKTFKVSQQGLSYDAELSDRFDQADLPVFKKEAIAAEPWTGGIKSFDGGALMLADNDGDNVYDCVKLMGNPVDLALKMLLSGGGNGVGPVSGTDYDKWPVWAGAGLTIDEVDITWCEAERAKILTVSMSFVCAGQESAKAFIEEEICRALGGYTLLSGMGKIRVHFPSAPISTADLPLIDDSVLIAKPLPLDSSEYHITHITYALADMGDGPTITLKRASPEYLSGQFAGEERTHDITSRGLQPTLGGVGIAHTVMDALFARYGAPPPRVRLTVFFKKHRIEAGDVVRFSSQFWTDWDGRGITAERLLEVLSVKTSVDRVELDCVDLTIPLTAGQRAVIAPNFSPAVTWATASEAQKQYAFIANQATGQFSDSTPAMVWG